MSGDSGASWRTGEPAASTERAASTALAARLATRVQRRFARAGGWPSVVFIDGRSGSGKTTLAEAVAEQLVGAGCARPQIVGMDELYPGWRGLAAGSASVAGMLRTGRYRRYDWFAKHFTPEVTLDREAPIIVEGCGSLSAASLEAARELGQAYAVWIECPTALRRQRAIARDGETFLPHWDAWATQEERHFAAAQPLARVHEVVHVGERT